GHVLPAAGFLAGLVQPQLLQAPLAGDGLAARGRVLQRRGDFRRGGGVRVLVDDFLADRRGQFPGFFREQRAVQLQRLVRLRFRGGGRGGRLLFRSRTGRPACGERGREDQQGEGFRRHGRATLRNRNVLPRPRQRR